TGVRRARRPGQPPRAGTGWALFAFASYLPFASSALTLVRQSADAVISYHPPSAKSISARPLQFTVTTRPMRLANRARSGFAAFPLTNWSVPSALRASIWAGVGVIMGVGSQNRANRTHRTYRSYRSHFYWNKLTKRRAVARRGRVEVEPFQELA